MLVRFALAPKAGTKDRVEGLELGACARHRYTYAHSGIISSIDWTAGRSRGGIIDRSIGSA
jgi:hypothetical protein